MDVKHAAKIAHVDRPKETDAAERDKRGKGEAEENVDVCFGHCANSFLHDVLENTGRGWERLTAGFQYSTLDRN